MKKEMILLQVKYFMDNSKDVLFGTQSIFSEGISIDNLSCLILGTPINNEPLLNSVNWKSY